jgi:hypothetical protein
MTGCWTVVVLVLAGLASAQGGGDVERAVAALRAAESHDSDAVGNDGSKSVTHAAYEVLAAKADAARLLEWSRDASPVLRCYAVQALLAHRSPADLLALALEHVEDRQPTMTVRGCARVEQRAGDVIVDLVLPRLDEAQRQTLEERLVAAGTGLYARERALASRRFRDELRPRIRKLAEQGDDAALVALARYCRAEDVAVLAASLRRDGKIRHLVYPLRAAAAFPHRDLLPLLCDMRPEAMRTLREDVPYRLRFWLAAIAAHDNADAARFLNAFLLDEAVPVAKQRQLGATYLEVLDATSSSVLLPVKEAAESRSRGKRP